MVEGSSLWIPYGHVPLVVGVPKTGMTIESESELRPAKKAKTSEGQKTMEVICYGISLAYDLADLGANNRMDLQVAASFIQAEASMFKHIKSSAEVQAWRAKLTEAKAGTSQLE